MVMAYVGQTDPTFLGFNTHMRTVLARPFTCEKLEQLHEKEVKYTYLQCQG